MRLRFLRFRCAKDGLNDGHDNSDNLCYHILPRGSFVVATTKTRKKQTMRIQQAITLRRNFRRRGFGKIAVRLKLRMHDGNSLAKRFL